MSGTEETAADESAPTATPGESTTRRQFLKATGAGSAAVLTGGVGTGLWTDRIVAAAEQRFPPVGEFTDVDGHRLHHVRGGTGDPVVLVHGDGGSVFDWTYSAFDRLAADYRAIAVDRPGFGYSDPPPDRGSPCSQAALLHDLFANTGVERPVVVGHSRGASVALAYATMYPGEIRGVVDLAGQPYEQDRSPLHFRLLTWPGLGPLAAETVFVPASAAQIEAGIRAAFEPEGTPPPAYLEAYVAMERRPTQLRSHAYDSVLAGQMHEELVPQYYDLDCPVAVVHGTADRNVPFEQATRLAEDVPESRLFDVPGAGHELAFYHPDVLQDAIDWVRTA